MRYMMIALFASLSLNASIYYAKVEPVQKYIIKAAVSGKVLHSNEKVEGRISNGGVIVKLDDILNKEDLKSSYKKLKFLEEMIGITKDNIKNAKIIADIKKNNYNKIKNLKTKPRVEKDNELINTVNAQSQVLNLMSNLENLKSQINDQKYKIATLKDQINKKRITIPKGYLIYKLYVKNGDFVNIGTPIVDAYDESKAKLTIYVLKEDYDLAKNGVIYIDGKPTPYKVDKLWNNTDTQNISSYKAEIVISAPKLFSKLVKIEFKAK